MPRAFDRMTTSVARTVPELKTAQGRGVQKAALETKNLINTEIRKVTGDMRMSGVGKRGAKVGARYDIKGSTNPTALVTAIGPIHLIERSVSPHLITPRSKQRTAKGRRRRGRKALAFNGGVYASAFHPGVRRSSGPFAKGAEKAAKVTPQIFKQQIENGLRRAWT